jgi:predicted short-subunit dehydrogenase-like oxidoreductase (DUF2520 family)
MRIVFIGAGNLAVNLALELKRRSFCIVQVFSRTMASATALATQVECSATNDTGEILSDADLYIFSVKDDALPSLLNRIPANEGLWVHTAGSVPMSIFDGCNANCGVAYPFQTFSKDRKVEFKTVPFFIEASTPENLEKIKSVFSKLSDVLIELPSEKRKYLHLTGVFACNFVNHLYVVAKKILEKENLPFDILLPLIDETAAKVHELPPEAAQTGPALRFDKNIIHRHLSMLDNPRLKEIYRLISENIYEINKQP